VRKTQLFPKQSEMLLDKAGVKPVMTRRHWGVSGKDNFS
jgi:hypothetical protein